MEGLEKRDKMEKREKEEKTKKENGLSCLAFARTEQHRLLYLCVPPPISFSIGPSFFSFLPADRTLNAAYLGAALAEHYLRPDHSQSIRTYLPPKQIE
jgi:hypothetical protein